MPDEGLFNVVDMERRGRGRPMGAKDPAPGSDDEYSLSKFYLKASDKHGHSKAYTVQIAKDWVPLIAQIVDKVPEYEYPAALIRDALYHRVHYLLEELGSPELDRIFAQRRLEDAMDAQVAEAKANGRRVEKAREEIGSLKAAGDWRTVRNQIRNLREWAEGVPEPYRQQALDLAYVSESGLPE